MRYLLLLLFLYAFQSSAFAHENYCHTAEACKEERSLLHFKLSQIEKKIIELSLGWNILARNANGLELRKPLRQAKEYCRTIGARIPTIREFAQLYTALGAGEIRESNFTHLDSTHPELQKELKLMKKDHYYPVTENLRNNYDYKVLFYTTRVGYIKPLGLTGWKSLNFWTTHKSSHNEGIVAGVSGEFFRAYFANSSAFLCIKKDKASVLPDDISEDPSCSDMADCTKKRTALRKRLIRYEKKIEELSIYHLDQVERDNNGKVLLMDYPEAKKLCASKGARLPNMREYATLGTAYGGSVVDTSYPSLIHTDPRVKAEIRDYKHKGYFVYYRENAHKEKVVYFYYTPQLLTYFDYSDIGYVPPTDPITKRYWRHWTNNEGYVFKVGNGRVDNGWVNKPSVRCLYD